jgi:hypothetical protein
MTHQEVEMRKTVLALVTCVSLIVLSLVAAAADKVAIDDQIAKILASLDNRDAPDSGKVMVLSLMNAIALAAPETSFGEGLSDQVVKAEKIFASTSIFNPDGKEYLHKSYRLTHSGKDFRMPDSIMEISDAVDYAKKRLATAREDLKSGKMDACVQKLLEITVMILTPKVKEQ